VSQNVERRSWTRTLVEVADEAASYQRELDKGKVIRDELVVPRRDPTALLDSVAEAFDEVAGLCRGRD